MLILSSLKGVKASFFSLLICTASILGFTHVVYPCHHLSLSFRSTTQTATFEKPLSKCILSLLQAVTFSNPVTNAQFCSHRYIFFSDILVGCTPAYFGDIWFA